MALKKARKQITLPVSQEKLIIRRLGSYDLVKLGQAPDVLKAEIAAAKAKAAGGEAPVEPKKSVASDPAMIDYTVAGAVMAIVGHPPNKKIVAKDPMECRHIGPVEEFSFFDLPDDDQNFLVKEAWDMVGEKEAAEAAATFPPGGSPDPTATPGS